MWQNLTESQKIKFEEYCDLKYGKSGAMCETGEPLYFDENANLIDTKMIIDLLFCVVEN